MANFPTPQQILDAFRNAGLRVVELPGWRDRCRCHDGSHERGEGRNSRGWGPWNGVTIHHTGGPQFSGQKAIDYANGILRQGDPSRSLPGPLCLASVDADGVIILVGAGRANHIGMISQRGVDLMRSASFSLDNYQDVRGSGVDGNGLTLGFEIQAPGAPNNAQRDAAVRAAAALCRIPGWTGQEVHGHGEVSDQREYEDPGLNMGAFRRDVMAAVKGGGPAPAAAPAGPPTVRGAIKVAWEAAGGPNSPVGNPVENEQPSAKAGAVYQRFERGLALWSEATGAHLIYGEIGKRYAAMNWEHGIMGLPIGPESDCARKGGRYQHFQGGALIWSLDSGAWESRGALREMWARDGYESGKWGYPVGPINYNPNLNDYWQDYQGGRLVWKVPATPASPTAPATSKYVRPVDDPGAHPISAAWHIPGSWAAGHHTGVDIACPVGTPVHATIGGDVRMNRSWGAAYGTVIYINDNEDGSDWGYCHLSRRVVSDGQRVETGQLIGYSGNTGNTTGPHLHLERRPRGGGYGTDLNPNLWP